MSSPERRLMAVEVCVMRSAGRCMLDVSAKAAVFLLASLKELFRILRPGGSMLIFVWAFEQEVKSLALSCCFPLPLPDLLCIRASGSSRNRMYSSHGICPSNDTTPTSRQTPQLPQIRHQQRPTRRSEWKERTVYTKGELGKSPASGHCVLT